MIETLAGSADSRVQQYLRSGEEVLRDGQYYQARSYFERAARLTLENPAPRMNLAAAAYMQEDYETAEAAYKSVLEIAPRSGDQPFAITEIGERQFGELKIKSFRRRHLADCMVRHVPRRSRRPSVGVPAHFTAASTRLRR